MLSASDPVTWNPRRITVAGVSGVGKTTLAARIARKVDAPHTEIDGLFHGENWTPRPQFDSEVDAITSAPAWVIEWQYPTARPVLAARADTLVWLDLPMRVALSRVLRRTVARSRSNEPLWNGNTEGPLRGVFTDPEHILRWAVKTQRKLKRRVPETEREYPHLRIVRLRSQRDVERWLAAL